VSSIFAMIVLTEWREHI